MKKILSLSLLLLPMLAAPALAQMPGGPAPGQPGYFGPKREGRKPGEPAPAGVPGARAGKDEVAPAPKNIGDMPPTEALFDAINRGDLAAAKDAVSRGADLDSPNVLGLTPIEQAVDLGRNQLSFYLLSLRGSVSAGGPSRAAAATPTRAERMAADRETRAQKIAQQKAARAAAAQPAPQKTARLFANNGGAPVPQAGFLGFDAR